MRYVFVHRTLDDNRIERVGQRIEFVGRASEPLFDVLFWFDDYFAVGAK